MTTCESLFARGAFLAGLAWLNMLCSAGSDAASVSTRIVAWGGASGVETNIPPNLTNVIAIATDEQYSLALLGEGTVTYWDTNGRTFTIPGFTNVIAIAAGGVREHSLALKSDGTVVEKVFVGTWNIEEVLPAGLTNIVAIARNSLHNLALKADGTVVEWVDNDINFGNGYASSSGELVLVPDGLSNVVAIAAGDQSLALKDDGTVVTWWGKYSSGINWAQNTSVVNVPAGLSNVVAIAAGKDLSLALRADGNVVAWGEFGYNFGNFPRSLWSFGPVTVPGDLTSVVALAAGTYQCLALKANGTVVTWGPDTTSSPDGPSLILTSPPPGLSNVIAVASSWTGDNDQIREQALALVGSSPPVLQAEIATVKREPNGFSCSVPSQSGKVFRLEYKDSLADPEWTALPLVAGNGSTLTLTDSTATDSQRFYRVRRW